MNFVKRTLGLPLVLGLTGLAGCSGGVAVSGRSAPASAAKPTETMKPLDFTVDVKGTGAGFGLDGITASPTVMIYTERLNFTMDCSPGGGSATAPFMATGTDHGNDNTFITAAFATTVPSYCVTPTVVSLVGKFANATTGPTFTLLADALPTTYSSVSTGWDVHASFTHVTGPVVWTALFEFDKTLTTDDPSSNSITARDPVNGTITVSVTDRCAGAATVAAVGSSTTAFTVQVPHTLTAPRTQWTSVVEDSTGAVSSYTEDGVWLGAGPHYAQWTFDFSSATTNDAAVHYKLTTSGAGGMDCIADVLFAVTALGSAISIP